MRKADNDDYEEDIDSDDKYIEHNNKQIKFFIKTLISLT